MICLTFQENSLTELDAYSERDFVIFEIKTDTWLIGFIVAGSWCTVFEYCGSEIFFVCFYCSYAMRRQCLLIAFDAFSFSISFDNITESRYHIIKIIEWITLSSETGWRICAPKNYTIFISEHGLSPVRHQPIKNQHCSIVSRTIWIERDRRLRQNRTILIQGMKSSSAKRRAWRININAPFFK